MRRLVPAAWSREPLAGVTLRDLFTIQRGLVTGASRFFILDRDAIAAHGLPLQWFRPILPSPSQLPVDEIPADAAGDPCLERPLYLLDCKLSDPAIRVCAPALWEYLQSGVPTISGRFLCRHRQPWYAQERRPAAPFLCSPLERARRSEGRSLRFVWNRSRATAAKAYLLLYPRPILLNALARDDGLASRIWAALNGLEGKVAPGEDSGLEERRADLQPRDVAGLPAGPLLELIPGASKHWPRQLELFPG